MEKCLLESYKVGHQLSHAGMTERSHCKESYSGQENCTQLEKIQHNEAYAVRGEGQR